MTETLQQKISTVQSHYDAFKNAPVITHVRSKLSEINSDVGKTIDDALAAIDRVRDVEIQLVKAVHANPSSGEPEGHVSPEELRQVLTYLRELPKQILDNTLYGLTGQTLKAKQFYIQTIDLAVQQLAAPGKKPLNEAQKELALAVQKAVEPIINKYEGEKKTTSETYARAVRTKDQEIAAKDAEIAALRAQVQAYKDAGADDLASYKAAHNRLAKLQEGLSQAPALQKTEDYQKLEQMLKKL